jgi:hypothetical protein
MHDKSMYDFDVPERTRNLLENFDVIASSLYMALVPGDSIYAHFKSNVRAAIVASTLGLSSLDYAHRRYVSKKPENYERPNKRDIYTQAYFVAKQYMSLLVDRLESAKKPDPTVGVFGAALVLERLKPSFFSAHFLYRLGHNYEGHAVARLILEQIAWAFCAYQSDDMDFIEAIQTTKAITALKRFFPEAGKLYGFLSTKTHIDYSSHMEFMRVENGRGIVFHAQHAFDECTKVILLLADMFGLVWEVTQADYLTKLEAVVKFPNSAAYLPNPERGFLAEANAILNRMKEAQNSTES